MKTIIEIEGLYKSFGEVQAVRDLSFSVREGEFFAFLGENGAGKSTTIHILCGQLAKDRGRVVIDGINLDENLAGIKEKIGVVFQSSALDAPLSVRDNLASRAALYGICGEAFEKRLSELSRLLDFESLLKRTVGKLSGGQRRRIDIARALLHSPKILILDEPTTGLDPQTRKLLWHVIDNLRRSEKTTVFLTTHYMEEAAEADHVVILEQGSLIAEGSPLALKKAYAGDFILLYSASEAEVSALGVPFEPISGGYRLAVPSTAAATELILKNPELFLDYEILKGTMDDVFLAATGKSLKGEDGK